MIYFTAHTINCVCHSIRTMFRVLGIYNFAQTQTFLSVCIFPLIKGCIVLQLFNQRWAFIVWNMPFLGQKCKTHHDKKVQRKKCLGNKYKKIYNVKSRILTPVYNMITKFCPNFPFIDNLTKPACASKQDRLVLETLQ